MGKARAVGEEQGIIRCPCRYNQNVGEMIQCEECHVWQHFTCVGIRKTNVPDFYTCERCSKEPILFECPCQANRSSKGIAKCFSCGKWQHLTCVGVSPSEMVDDYKCLNCRDPSAIPPKGSSKSKARPNRPSTAGPLVSSNNNKRKFSDSGVETSEEKDGMTVNDFLSPPSPSDLQKKPRSNLSSHKSASVVDIILGSSSSSRWTLLPNAPICVYNDDFESGDSGSPWGTFDFISSLMLRAEMMSDYVNLVSDWQGVVERPEGFGEDNVRSLRQQSTTSPTVSSMSPEAKQNRLVAKYAALCTRWCQDEKAKRELILGLSLLIHLTPSLAEERLNAQLALVGNNLSRCVVSQITPESTDFSQSIIPPATPLSGIPTSPTQPPSTFPAPGAAVSPGGVLVARQTQMQTIPLEAVQDRSCISESTHTTHALAYLDGLARLAHIAGSSSRDLNSFLINMDPVPPEEMAQRGVATNIEMLAALIRQPRPPTSEAVAQPPPQLPEVKLKLVEPRPGQLAVVCDETVTEGTFLLEYIGHVMMHNEFFSRHPNRSHQWSQVVFPPRLDVCVDSRSSGSYCKFMRRSCTPSCCVRMYKLGGKMRVGVFALRPLRPMDEVTIAFDYAWRLADRPDCACNDPQKCVIVLWNSKRQLFSQRARRPRKRERPGKEHPQPVMRDVEEHTLAMYLSTPIPPQLLSMTSRTHPSQSSEKPSQTAHPAPPTQLPTATPPRASGPATSTSPIEQVSSSAQPQAPPAIPEQAGPSPIHAMPSEKLPTDPSPVVVGVKRPISPPPLMLQPSVAVANASTAAASPSVPQSPVATVKPEPETPVPPPFIPPPQPSPEPLLGSVSAGLSPAPFIPPTSPLSSYSLNPSRVAIAKSPRTNEQLPPTVAAAPTSPSPTLTREQRKDMAVIKMIEAQENRSKRKQEVIVVPPPPSAKRPKPSPSPASNSNSAHSGGVDRPHRTVEVFRIARPQPAPAPFMKSPNPPTTKADNVPPAISSPADYHLRGKKAWARAFVDEAKPSDVASPTADCSGNVYSIDRNGVSEKGSVSSGTNGIILAIDDSSTVPSDLAPSTPSSVPSAPTTPASTTAFAAVPAMVPIPASTLTFSTTQAPSSPVDEDCSPCLEVESLSDPSHLVATPDAALIVPSESPHEAPEIPAEAEPALSPMEAYPAAPVDPPADAPIPSEIDPVPVQPEARVDTAWVQAVEDLPETIVPSAETAVDTTTGGEHVSSLPQ